MSIVRSLPPGTKVFITADHGFGPVGWQPLWFDENDLNEASDCVYLNCLLKETIGQANISSKVRDNVIAFKPEQLQMPTTESRTTKAGQVIHKEYKAVVFPKWAIPSVVQNPITILMHTPTAASRFRSW